MLTLRRPRVSWSRVAADDAKWAGSQYPGRIATNGVNVTKLESYSIEGSFEATQFYADLSGHPDELPVRRALEELSFFSASLNILGVYRAHPFRAV